MFCPKCHAEYRPGFTQCVDCQVALVTELPTDSLEPDDWIPVLETNNPFTMELAKKCLEDADIPFLDNSEDTSARLIIGAAFPLCRFLVPSNYELDARAVLENLTPDNDPEATNSADDQSSPHDDWPE